MTTLTVSQIAAIEEVLGCPFFAANLNSLRTVSTVYRELTGKDPNGVLSAPELMRWARELVDSLKESSERPEDYENDLKIREITLNVLYELEDAAKRPIYGNEPEWWNLTTTHLTVVGVLYGMSAKQLSDCRKLPITTFNACFWIPAEAALIAALTAPTEEQPEEEPAPPKKKGKPAKNSEHA